MANTYLLAGASSAMAQSLAGLINNDGDTAIGITTNDFENAQFNTLYRTPSYTKENLPDIEGKIDGLVFFCGSINLKPFARISAEEFLSDYQLMALNAVNVIQKYLGNLKQAETASIVLISTVASAQGMPFHTSVAMAKSALEGLAISLAAEFAPTIRVNVVAPSLTQTPMAERLINSPEKLEASAKRHPLKRIGQAEDIANTIHFLLGKKASFITGQIMHVDGGMAKLKIM
jgi:NAD(P)-dependent dehydrogenase (short-subunit alcohol dehydrogenase family)